MNCLQTSTADDEAVSLVIERGGMCYAEAEIEGRRVVGGRHFFYEDAERHGKCMLRAYREGGWEALMRVCD